MFEKKIIFEVTVWKEIYVGSNYRQFWRFFSDLRKLNPVKTNSLKQKSTKNLLLSLHCWTSMKLVANSVTKTTIWLPFLFLSNTVQNIREKLFLRVKSEIQIHNFVPAKPEKSKIREKFPRKISCHTVNCERVRFSNSCNLSAFVSRFQQSRIWELRKFFGHESHRPPPKSESSRTPMLLPLIFVGIL